MNNDQSTNRAVELAWFKSGYSGTSGGDCLEVAVASGAVHVRDSKRLDGLTLQFQSDAWPGFLAYATGTDV